MASKTLLFLLGLTIIAVAYGAWLGEEVDESEELTVEDLQEYFSPIEKRGSKSKVGRKVIFFISPLKYIHIRLFP